jgi:myo-inositol-1(or 4)-monophosphatase
MKNIERFLQSLIWNAGRRLGKRFGKVKSVHLKGGASTNLVTNVDKEIESFIKREIRSEFPRDGIIAEESPAEDPGSDRRWIIDPLDGTTNFAHGFPAFSVSIAVENEGEIVAGGVYNPMWEELFFASKGRGATLNRRKIRISTVRTLAESLLVTGFPYDIHEHPERSLPFFDAFIRRAQGLRRVGSAALDLCYVAMGRFDGFFEVSLHPWDTAAGMIILREAGGEITDFQGRSFTPYDKQLVASNGRIHKEMLSIISNVQQPIGGALS